MLVSGSVDCGVSWASIAFSFANTKPGGWGCVILLGIQAKDLRCRSHMGPFQTVSCLVVHQAVVEVCVHVGAWRIICICRCVLTEG